jgi:hypothetical protein
MVEPPRRVDLRLTIPVAAPYPEVARDLAQKFVEYAGAPAASASQVAGAIDAAVAAADDKDSLQLRLSAAEGDVTVSVTPAD